MIKHLLCTSVFLFGAMALRADDFNFNYEGSGVTAELILTATSSGDSYTVTGISGTFEGAAIGDLVSGSFDYDGTTISDLSVIYGIGSGTEDVWSTGGGFYSETSGGVTITNMTDIFAPARMPEPASIPLFLATGLGVWFLARRLPLRSGTRP